MNGVFIIPTGIGCEIGGHAGDAVPAAKLVASVCDKLIVNPNAVNASMINEMSENMLYVEGSTIDRFLKGDISLRYSNGNKILLVVNEITPDVVNCVSAARANIGCEIKILKLDTPLLMWGWIKNGLADGKFEGVQDLITQVSCLGYDALAIATEIQIDEDVALKYWREGGINPWGWIEAQVSKKIATALDKPIAHAPIDDVMERTDSEYRDMFLNEIVDPRMAAELISACYVHCVFKGLHKAPRICVRDKHDLYYSDIDFLISPYGCIGRPHLVCIGKDIPVIIVKENKTVLNDIIPHQCVIVENYLEAVGYIALLKTGISVESIRRPLKIK